MYMILQLHNDKYLDDVILALAEAGIADTIVLSGESLGQKMLYDIPLFVSFQDTAAMRTGYGNVIMGPAEEEEVMFALEELKNSGLDLLQKKLATIYLLPVERIIS
ncbi:MAG: hypothetical protein PHU99_00965 [Candidatus Cloacimonetes bacterium]|jgi:hypothetical protein|nr:hypothetical protein [Candidatus Cloacimonadota bacterium]MDY0337014.1 hypothetical protein [Candidatus Cloacimonadaceae bacterium]MCB5269089.1 hypothetical protein [Candidatus Cloacimonadota bacterium]MCK9334676.1 hypothetical protein [Candidatus Cloacimonadota bacterium]MDD2543351.1 hypothetical protein [Candidatus Cloacimonadota bacterium]